MIKIRNIKCVVEFGSYSRGDNDQYSDYDVCVFATNSKLDEYKKKEAILESMIPLEIPRERISFVFYNENQLSIMINEGSLFLWHLKKEAKILFGSEYFEYKLLNLKSFDKHLEDLNYHKEIFQELKNSYAKIKMPNVFDLSLMFTISRNTCMLLCHKYGQFKFGRLDSFNACEKLFSNFPLSLDDYMYLASKKNHYERGVKSELYLEIYRFEGLITELNKLLEYASKKISNN
jgi:predicted nucleotidyltransferase